MPWGGVNRGGFITPADSQGHRRKTSKAGHSERSEPTFFFRFAPAKRSACAVRNLSPPTSSFCLLVSSFPFRDALAYHQGRLAASTGRHSLLVCGWVGASLSSSWDELPCTLFYYRQMKRVSIAN